ncbi:hypothetical protein [Roseibium sp. MMSF_3412]|uniref:hypothetical protein n=1 Tax=Roseibium sp. MMSF_3412 TaxID=3046712 RepID=UPI00273FAD00|nr:hypothetical protein [Roseibium sp. MMSF_3412]
MKTVSFPTFSIMKIMIIPVLLLIAGAAHADELSEDQVAELRQQMIVCNADPIPTHDRCLEIHERLKDHYGGYEGYLAAFPCSNGPDCSRYGIRRSASAEPVDTRMKLEDERRGYDQLTAEQFIEAKDDQTRFVGDVDGATEYVVDRYLTCSGEEKTGPQCTAIKMETYAYFAGVTLREYQDGSVAEQQVMRDQGEKRLNEYLGKSGNSVAHNREEIRVSHGQQDSGVDLLTERLHVIGRHLECLKSDPQEKLSSSHELICMRIYMDAKLHFVGVEYDEYVLLPLEQRNELDERGRLMLEQWITVQTDDLS